MSAITQNSTPKIGGSFSQASALKPKTPVEEIPQSFQEYLPSTKVEGAANQTSFSKLTESSLTALSSLTASAPMHGHEGFSVLQTASQSAASQFSSSINEVI